MTDNANKPVTVIYTGGTIGMVRSELGLVPSDGFETELKARCLEAGYPSHQGWKIQSMVPLFDSANLGPDQWIKIAERVRQHADGASRVVVVHGTDTLAYTGSALSFLLCELSTPVVLTGAQHPLGVDGSDALENFLGALSCDVNQGVWLHFAKQTMPANRSMKWDALGLNAFCAPRADSLDASMPLREPVSLASRTWLAASSARISCHRAMPGESVGSLKALAQAPPHGLVLSVYGAGTLADQDQDLITALKHIAEQGTVIVAVSQCLKGHLAFDRYATGSQLVQLGIVNGRDMTVEAAYTKLCVLFRLGFCSDEVRSMMNRNIAGEINLEN